MPHIYAIDTDYISYEDERKLIQKDVGNSHSSPYRKKEEKKRIFLGGINTGREQLYTHNSKSSVCVWTIILIPSSLLLYSQDIVVYV